MDSSCEACRLRRCSAASILIGPAILDSFCGTFTEVAHRLEQEGRACPTVTDLALWTTIPQDRPFLHKLCLVRY